MLDQFREISVSCVPRPAPLVRGSSRCRAVVRMTRTIFFSGPNCEQFLGHCVLGHPVRHTPDDASLGLMAQEKRFNFRGVFAQKCVAPMRGVATSE